MITIFYKKYIPYYIGIGIGLFMMYKNPYSFDFYTVIFLGLFFQFSYYVIFKW